VIARAAVAADDEPTQARYEASDLIQPVAEGLLSWDDVRGIDEIIAGFIEGRRSFEDITVFKSLGAAIGDVLLAARAYERAMESGYGVKLPELSGEVP
jgi:ornithine cyclodeaminase